jgi:hypothetical protein
MNRPILIALPFLCASLISAQNPLSTEAKQAYSGIKNNLTKMAEKVPADVYSFKATPDVRTFGQLIGHVADSQLRSCSTVRGETKQASASSKTTKEELVAALKESFAECDAAFEALTDASATEMVKFRNGTRSKLGILNGVTIHSNEEYGYMCVYLRLKGIVPPSSEGR